MPRVIVTTGGPSREPEDAVLLDELVASVHLSDRHAAAQLIERLAWAIGDAERAEAATSATPSAVGSRSRRGGSSDIGAARQLPSSAEAIAA